MVSTSLYRSRLFSKLTPSIAAVGLSDISTAQLINPTTGIDDRTSLLLRLSSALSDPSNAKFFSQDGVARPGHLVDYLLAHPASLQVPSPNSYKIAVEVDTLWEAVVDGLSGVWRAAGTQIDGVSLGDVWPLRCLRKQDGEESDSYISFHGLGQWLMCSIIEVIDKTLGWKVIGADKLTGRPDYHNAGLLIDFDLLKPNLPALFESFNRDMPDNATLLDVPPLPTPHPAVVELRAVTVIMLDRLATGVRKKLGAKLTLSQVVEAGTRKAAAEVARQQRPTTGGPPFRHVADGIVW